MSELKVGDRVRWWGINGVGIVEKLNRPRTRRTLFPPPSYATVVWRPAKGGKITATWLPAAELRLVGEGDQ